MESEDRRNPLSKVEAIEKLRTTIGKLETIIEQLNSASVVDLPSANPVGALITTTEELENAISNLSPEIVDSEESENAIAADLPSETVEPESEITTISNEVTEDAPEVVPLASQEEPSDLEPEITLSEPSESDTPAPQPPITETPKNTTVTTATKAKTAAQTKLTKPKKKKNWLAIAIIALIIAVIPISLKYLSTRSIPQVSSEKVAEIPIEKAPLIATNLPENNLEKDDAVNEITEEREEINISETPENQIDDIAIVNTSEQIIEDEATEVSPIDSIAEKIAEPDLGQSLVEDEVTEVSPIDSIVAEKIAEPDLEQSLIEDEDQSFIASVSDIETSITKDELETEIALDVNEVAVIDELGAQTPAELPLDIDKTADRELENTVDLAIDDIPEIIVEPEPKILVPENLVAGGAEQILELKTVIHDVKLTPEQNLIAVLSAKVLQLSEDYKEDIVLSVEPNMANDVLIVRVTDDWYQLENGEQDEIVATMFTRSQDLEFRKLEITDQNDNLVARSPVIGQNMIIFRRDSQVLTSEV